MAYGYFPRFPAPILFVSSGQDENRGFWAEFEDSVTSPANFPAFFPVLRKAAVSIKILRDSGEVGCHAGNLASGIRMSQCASIHGHPGQSLRAGEQFGDGGGQALRTEL